MNQDFRMGYPAVLNALYDREVKPSLYTPPRKRLTREEQEKRKLLDVTKPLEESKRKLINDLLNPKKGPIVGTTPIGENSGSGRIFWRWNTASTCLGAKVYYKFKGSRVLFSRDLENWAHSDRSVESVLHRINVDKDVWPL